MRSSPLNIQPILLAFMISSINIPGVLAGQTTVISAFASHALRRAPPFSLHGHQSFGIARSFSRSSVPTSRSSFLVTTKNLKATISKHGKVLLRSTENDDSTTKVAEETSFANKNNLDDQVFSAISKCGGIKVTCATVRNMVNDAMIQHTLNPVPADALARSMTCGLLLSNGMPNEHIVQITINGDGPLRGICTITNGLGECKGYVGAPGLNGFTLEEAVGKGTVQVVKNHPDWPNPYNGITSIIKGDIDEDMGIYLAESEQRACALAAATSMNGILCTSAGGYLVEQLPFCDQDTVAKVEENLKVLVEKDGSDNLPTNLLLNGYTPYDIAEIILDGLDMQPLQQITPSMNCGCSDDRLIRSLRLLPTDEVDALIESQECIEARCEFCGKVYRMGPDEVRKRMELAKEDPALDD